MYMDVRLCPKDLRPTALTADGRLQPHEDPLSSRRLSASIWKGRRRGIQLLVQRLHREVPRPAPGVALPGLRFPRRLVKRIRLGYTRRNLASPNKHTLASLVI